MDLLLQVVVLQAGCALVRFVCCLVTAGCGADAGQLTVVTVDVLQHGVVCLILDDHRLTHLWVGLVSLGVHIT